MAIDIGKSPPKLLSFINIIYAAFAKLSSKTPTLPLGNFRVTFFSVQPCPTGAQVDMQKVMGSLQIGRAVSNNEQTHIYLKFE